MKNTDDISSWNDPIRWAEPELALALKKHCEANPRRFNIYDDLARQVGYERNLEGNMIELRLLASELITLPQFATVKIAFLKEFIEAYDKAAEDTKPNRFQLDHTRKPPTYHSE